MSIGFLNAAMLAGLLAVGLPVLAHLLSKRRYNVEYWGAMQFLRLGHKTRRRIRFQDLLLLLLRMGVLACLAFALARPWGQGGVFGSLADSVSRDVVFVLDGSGSMDWRGGEQTPHQRAIQWVHTALEELHPGDTVALIDARSSNRKLIHPPTSDFAKVRRHLEEIPAPAGSSNLTSAVLESIQILSATANVSREVIVLTDFQAFPWKTEDQLVWDRIDDLREEHAIAPSISVVDLSDADREVSNLSVDRIDLSREMTVPGFPIRLQAKIRQTGGVTAEQEVSLKINGQRSNELTRFVNLLPNGEAMVDFTHVFTQNGHYVVTVSVGEDDLPNDNLSNAVVVVEDGIPVMLVDGDQQQDETKSDAFFLSAAFASSGDQSLWIRATHITPRQLNAATLDKNRVVFLCNVSRLNPQQQADLLNFVNNGGGLVVAPGDRLDSQYWNELQIEEGAWFLPAEFVAIESEAEGTDEQVTIDSDSLKAPWLERFDAENGVDLTAARFSSWWALKRFENRPLIDLAANDQAEGGGEFNGTANQTTSVVARLSNQRPLMMASKFGNGTIITMSTPLDADWSTLPARTDFVPFVHELVFQIADLETRHNVEVGGSLRLQLKEDERPRDFVVSGPLDSEASPILKRSGRKSFAVFTETTIAGVYHFEKQHERQATPIPYAVTDDPTESNLTPLDELGWETIAGDERISSIESMSELTARNQGTFARTELWWLLMCFILVMLVGEVLLTRRMLQGGHDDLIDDRDDIADFESA